VKGSVWGCITAASLPVKSAAVGGEGLWGVPKEKGGECEENSGEGEYVSWEVTIWQNERHVWRGESGDEGVSGTRIGG